MQIKNNLSRSAFSLIELSVVILIIGILVIGISKGSRIINESRLKSAATLTKGSPVNLTEGLVLWLDSTNKDNIAVGTAGAGVYGIPVDNNDVTDWKSQNPHITSAQINLSTVTASRPKYIQKGAGGLPTISFDGVDDYLETTTNTPLRLGSQEFTYIVVWERITPIASGFAMVVDQNCNASGATCQLKEAGLFVGSANTSGFLGGNNDAGTISVPDGLNHRPSISVIYSTANTDTLKFYHNSRDVAATGSGNGNAANVVISNNIFVVGAKGVVPKIGFFNGNISEVIVFDRALQDKETKGIIDYLARKYSIKVS